MLSPRSIAIVAIVFLISGIAVGRAGDEPLPGVEVGLSGRRMAESNRRRIAVSGGGRFQIEGDAAVGTLVVGSKLAAVGKSGVLGLRTLEIETSIEGLTARTTVKHVFENDTDAILEGVFTFPLPAGAAVDRFAMTIQSETDLMEGSLVDKGTAHTIYTQLVYGLAVDPGILEWVGANTFRATIFPIPARGTKTIVISFLQTLPSTFYSDGTRDILYTYPLAGSKSQIPSAAQVKLRATVHALDARSNVSATLHPAFSPLHDGVISVLSAFDGAHPPEADWVVSIEIPKPDSRSETKIAETDKGLKNEAPGFCELSAHRIEKDQPGTFALTIAPGSDAAPMPASIDTLFMLDTSVSRAPSEQAAAVAFIEASLRTLSESDRFAIVAFDITAQTLPGGFQSPTQANINAATGFMKGINLLGATDIDGAFSAAAAVAKSSAHKRLNVVYCGVPKATYGVRELGALSEAIRHRVSEMNAELICVWTGAGRNPADAGVNAELANIEKLASFTGGPVLQLTPGERFDGIVSQLAILLENPFFRNAKVKVTGIDGAELSMTAPVFSAAMTAVSPVTIFGRYEHAGPALVKLAGDWGGKHCEQEWRVTLPEQESANAAIEKLWARSRIGTVAGTGGEAAELSRKYGVLGKESAFLVLESEKMYENYAIKHDSRNPANLSGPDELRAKFLAGSAVSKELIADSGDGIPMSEAVSGIKFDLRVKSSAMNAPLEIGGVLMDISPLSARVSDRQKAGSPMLGKTQRHERRVELSRLIAAERLLPFEPETVFPKIWLDSFTKSGDPIRKVFALNADEDVWKTVEAQPAKAPDSWPSGPGAPNEKDEQIERLMHPIRPSVIKFSAEDESVQLESHILAHQILGSILLDHAPGMVRLGASNENSRAISERATKKYSLRSIPVERLGAAYNFLAELALVEGQVDIAGDLAACAIHLVDHPVLEGKSDYDDAARLSYLLKALSTEMTGNFRLSAQCYRKAIDTPAVLVKSGRELTYRALTTTMLLAGDKKGSLAVLEKWFAAEGFKAEMADLLGRMYLQAGRPKDAIRAFSTPVEFAPELGVKYATPEAFLKQAVQ